MMEKYNKEEVFIDIRIKSSIRTPYRDEYDITNNQKELIEDNLMVSSSSDNVVINDIKITDIY